MIILGLALLGLCAGSFVNALIWRVYQQSKQSTAGKKKTVNSKLYTNYSILHGRSMCINCKHQLATKDLVPIFSWLWLKGRCRYCKKPISNQYPIVELLTAVVFVLSYVFWPQDLTGGQWLTFGTWLLCSMGLIALAVYDLKWLLLPSRIIYPIFYIALAGRLSFILFINKHIVHDLLMLAGSLVVSSGFFWLMYQVSKGKWIGFGDVRLGLVTGTLLASPSLSAVMIFVASLLGTVSAIPGLITGKKTMASKLPYGPFLIVATAISLLFGNNLIDLYKKFLNI